LRERERIAEKVDDVFAQACPKQGKGAALIFPACNTEANLHLAEIALMVAPGAHAVLLINLVDGICPRDCSFPPKTPFSPCRQNRPSPIRSRTFGRPYVRCIWRDFTVPGS
jgi:hypothetical protein